MSTRRKILKQSSMVAALLASTGLFPQFGWAFNKEAFEAKDISKAVKTLGGSEPIASQEVAITGPDIAENGAVVPVNISSTLPGIKQLLLLVEKNPSALIASFDVSDKVDATFSTRTKMGQTSDVYAVAITQDGKAFFSKKEIKVTLGGCGG